tara:strand:- start:1 stop:579 length:579 start_codon:yes stop_codon:yes gene_type:complete
MERSDMLKHLNLLDREVKDDKTTLRFAENFEVQSSAEGDYYKPNASHNHLVYDVLKFKKLSIANSTDTTEIGSTTTTTIAPPPSGAIDDGVTPIMNDITLYRDPSTEVASTAQRLACITDFRFRNYIKPATGVQGDVWTLVSAPTTGFLLYSYLLIVSNSYTAWGTVHQVKVTSHEGRVSNIINVRVVNTSV